MLQKSQSNVVFPVSAFLSEGSLKPTDAPRSNGASIIKTQKSTLTFLTLRQHDLNDDPRQHRWVETAAFAEYFAPIVQCEKREIHPVFPLFPHFPLGQNLSAKALAPLCGIALII